MRAQMGRARCSLGSVPIVALLTGRAAIKRGEGMTRVLERSLIALLLLLGVLFVYQGFGVDFRILNFESLDPYGIPIGIALIVAAVLVARFWTIPG